MNYGKQYAWHTAITATSTVATGVLFYVLRIVFYNNLTAEEYGLFFSVYAFSTIIQPILSFGFDPGLVPLIAQYREENDLSAIKNVVVGSVVVQLSVAGCCALFALAIVPLVGRLAPAQPDLGFLVSIMVVHALAVVLFKSGQQFFLGMQAMTWRSAADVVRAILCMAGAVLLVGGNLGVKGAALAYLLAVIGTIAIQAVVIAVSFPEVARASFHWRGDLVSDAFRGGKYLSVAFGGFAVFSSLDTTVITIVRGNLLDVAAYQIAIPTVMIIYSLMAAGGLTFLPMARTLWVRGERELLADGISRIYEAAFAVIVLVGVLMAAFSDVLMRFLFGENILNAPEAFNILAVSGVFYFLSYLNLHILAGIGRARAAAVVIAVALGLDLALDPPLIYFFGIRGAALATFIGYFTATVLSYRAIRAELPVVIPWRTIGAACTLAGIAWYLCHLFRATHVFTEYGVFSAAFISGLLLIASTLVLEVSGCARLHELARVVLPKGRFGK